MSGEITCPRCGETECRRYGDLPANHCAAFGQCGEPGNLTGCTAFTDAPDGTACSQAACEGGAAACRAGGCIWPA